MRSFAASTQAIGSSKSNEEYLTLSELFNLGLGDFFDELLDDVLVGHPFGLGLKVRADAVAENRNRNFANVVDRHAEAAFHRRDRFAAVDQKLPGAGTSAPVDELFHKLGSRVVLRPRRANQAGGVLDDVRADG